MPRNSEHDRSGAVMIAGHVIWLVERDARNRVHDRSDMASETGLI